MVRHRRQRKKHPIRFLGVFLNSNLSIGRALLVFYGIGKVRIRQILNLAGIPPHKLVSPLSYSQISKLRIVLGQCMFVEGPLKRFKAESLKRHTDIGSAQGRRHWVGLPARGQRTRTNARTRKKNRPDRGKKKPDRGQGTRTNARTRKKNKNY